MIMTESGVVLRPLAGGALVIGRGADADVRVEDASLSRRHARVTVDGGAIAIEDLGSANGTRVGGVAIAAGRATPVPIGVAIELGDVMMVVRGDDAPVPRHEAGDERLLERVARSHVNVLIVGETGAGKERMAERIHRASRRAAGPLVRVNCAALADTLLDSELFGHEKGAFTGAAATRVGLIEAASGGTLFLDEVGELSASAQAKLLRVLEQREVVRVGAVQPIAVDVRFVAATHRDLPAMAADGRFRQDLYFRLDGFALRVPPLRERTGELPGLATALLVDASAREGHPPPPLAADALAAMLAYAWPGNVRELRNALDRALLRWTGEGPLTAAHLALPTSGAPISPAPAADDDAEKQRILAALEQHRGNQTAAAKDLGISRRTIVSRLQAWGMTRSRKP
ncbi:MAG: sigma 54-interacting transcriptional regulator [Deltaproteobacteria bacterium]|nr:sigma 54-interacting transcriptional regulator [Deltaproteobacteria bacterium]